MKKEHRPAVIIGTWLACAENAQPLARSGVGRGTRVAYDESDVMETAGRMPREKVCDRRIGSRGRNQLYAHTAETDPGHTEALLRNMNRGTYIATKTCCEQGGRHFQIRHRDSDMRESID